MATIRANANGYLTIDFRYRGKRYRLSTGLSDNKDNRKKASRTKGGIEYGVAHNNLDLSIYFPKIAKPMSNGTLGEFYDFFIGEKTLRYTTMKSMTSIWENHIKPYFYDYRWENITPHEVKVFRAMLDTEKKLKHNTINQIMTFLNGILIRAHEEGLISQNPFHKLRRLKTDKTKLNPFSFEELRVFLDFLSKNKPEYYDMVYIWSCCGFRHGEILALKWANLDYFNRTLYVESTLLDNGTESSTKTESSQRYLSLRPEVIEAFKRQAKRSRMLSEFIFPDPNTGKRYAMTNSFLKRFKILLQLAGLKMRSPNQLRHTFATLHIAAGENITWVSKMLGHSTVKMTLEKYNQYIPDLTREDGSAFEKVLKNSLFSHGLVTVIDN